MIKVVSDVSPKNQYQKSFGNKQNPAKSQPQNSADKFLSELEATNKKSINGNIFSKYFWSITALIASATPVLGYELGSLYKLRKLKKQENLLEYDSLYKSFNKRFKYVIAGGIVLYACLQYLFNLNNNKNYKKLTKDFTTLNSGTNAQLKGTFRSGYVGAYCTSASCNVRVNRNIMNDPISSRSLKKIIKHELVHARQFEIVARSKDGIKKLNYANVMNVVNQAQKNPKTVVEFLQIHKDIQNDKTGKYDKVEIDILGEKYNFKNYIEAIYIILTNEKATYNDIPIIINENHYKKVIEDRGPLNHDEEKKAEEYYNALINYKPISVISAFNPFGGYRNNILEKEAYKENPSLLMKLFGKE